MRELAVALYNASGLAAVSSPWVATLVLHLVLACYLAAVASTLVILARGRLGTATLAVRFLAWAAAVAVLATGLLSAVMTQSMLKHRDPAATASTTYDVYAFVCFAAPAALFLWLLHRGGFSRNWRQ